MIKRLLQSLESALLALAVHVEVIGWRVVRAALPVVVLLALIGVIRISWLAPVVSASGLAAWIWTRLHPPSS